MQPVINITTGTAAFASTHPGTEKIAAVVQSWLATAGINAAINITQNDGPDLLTVNGAVCRFPDSLATNIEAALAGWQDSQHEFWVHFIHQILWIQPKVFYTESMAEEMFGPKEKDGNYSFEEAVIKELLSLKIALPHKTTIDNISKSTSSAALLVEELTDTLSGKEISIHINPVYLEALISTAGSNLFELMRDGLFYETGITYPPFKIILQPALPISSFYFKINTYSSVPFTGLDSAAILVNDTPERLRLLGIEASPTENPANGYAASFIATKDKLTAEQSGCTTWDGFGYFILCFSSFLRQNGYLCVTKKLVTQYIGKIKPYYPALAGFAMQQEPLLLTTKILRRLAKEQISIRNMKLILEAIAEFDWIKADDERIIFDERVAVHVPLLADAPTQTRAVLVTEFVRAKMKRYLSHYYTRGQSTLVVYLIDVEIERCFKQVAGSATALSKTDEERILAATADEFKFLTATLQAPVVLTTQTVRPLFKSLMETVYPRIVVLSYQELTADMNIQPVARISWS